MTAARLRQAATVLRERAEAATPGPWRVGAEGSEGSRVTPNTGDKRTDMRFIANVNGASQPQDGRNATLIATMDPLVGAALADWLDRTADWSTPKPVAARANHLADLILGDQP